MLGPGTHRSGGSLVWPGLEAREEKLGVHQQRWDMRNVNSQSEGPELPAPIHVVRQAVGLQRTDSRS